MAKVVSSKAAQAKAREHSKAARRGRPDDRMVQSAYDVETVAVPQIGPGEVRCPVCSYGAVSAMTISGNVEDRTLFLHRGRMFPCRAQAAVLVA